MAFVIVDCGGFKQIVSTDRPQTLRTIQDNFRCATIEGDEFGKAKLLSGADVAKIFNGRSESKQNTKDMLEVNVKPVNRKK